MYTNDCIPIKDIRPGLKNINVQFIVLEVGNATVTKENREVRTFKVADQTACINVSIWGEPSGNGPGSVYFSPGDIVRLTKGYAVIWRQCLTLYSGKNGDINKLGDFCMLFNEQLNMSEPNPNFGPQQGGGPVGQQQTQQQQQQVLNGGTSIMNGNNNGRAGGGGAQGTSAFNGNPSSNSNNSTNPPAAATTKATRMSNENKGGASIANTAQKNSRGGRSSNSRSNVK